MLIDVKELEKTTLKIFGLEFTSLIVIYVLLKVL